MIKAIFLFAATGLLVYILFAYLTLRTHLARARELIASARPYEQHPASPDHKVLFLGDSTAAGTGTSEGKFSTAGRYGAKYPNSDITNLGQNGARIKGVSAQADTVEGQRYDLVIAQVGGNDILHFTPRSEVSSGISGLLPKLKKLSDKVILIHGGNMGASPAFPAGTKWLFSWRTRMLRDIYIKEAAKNEVSYVDLYTSLKDFPQERNGKATSASDGFHPSDEGYAIWFEHIERHL